jgi:hypothetical protein
MKTISNTAKAVIGVGLVAVGAIGGAVLHSTVSEPVVVTKNVTVDATPEQLKAAFDNGVASVKPEVIVKNVTEVVTVKVEDTAKLDAVLEHIYDNDGKIEYLTSDLKDSEVAQIADRIVLVNEFKALAVAEVKKELADLVDKEVVAGETIKDEDVERVRVNDDADEVLVEDIDFDDKDAELTVTGTFEADDIKYKYEVVVEFKDSKIDDSKLVKVELA